jgi:hypothetical protein
MPLLDAIRVRAPPEFIRCVDARPTGEAESLFPCRPVPEDNVAPAVGKANHEPLFSRYAGVAIGEGALQRPTRSPETLGYRSVSKGFSAKHTREKFPPLLPAVAGLFFEFVRCEVLQLARDGECFALEFAIVRFHAATLALITKGIGSKEL